jgi:hypothetical protein
MEEFSRTSTTPNSTLKPDWDVLHKVVVTFRMLAGITYNPKWIRSHQDLGNAYQTLSLAAQLNCDADEQAEAFHQSPDGLQSRAMVPMLPHASAHLLIQGNTITSGYKTALRHAATVPPQCRHTSST